jgi:hypothetical protein
MKKTQLLLAALLAGCGTSSPLEVHPWPRTPPQGAMSGVLFKLSTDLDMSGYYVSMVRVGFSRPQEKDAKTWDEFQHVDIDGDEINKFPNDVVLVPLQPGEYVWTGVKVLFSRNDVHHLDKDVGGAFQRFVVQPGKVTVVGTLEIGAAVKVTNTKADGSQDFQGEISVKSSGDDGARLEVVEMALMRPEAEMRGWRDRLEAARAVVSAQARIAALARSGKLHAIAVDGMDFAGPNDIEKRWEVVFLDGGMCAYGDQAQYTNCKWERTGDDIVLAVNDAYATYRCKLRENALDCAAHNIVNKDWHATLPRYVVTPPAATPPAVTPPAATPPAVTQAVAETPAPPPAEAAAPAASPPAGETPAQPPAEAQPPALPAQPPAAAQPAPPVQPAPAAALQPAPAPVLVASAASPSPMTTVAAPAEPEVVVAAPTERLGFTLAIGMGGGMSAFNRNMGPMNVSQSGPGPALDLFLGMHVSQNTALGVRTDLVGIINDQIRGSTYIIGADFAHWFGERTMIDLAFGAGIRQIEPKDGSGESVTATGYGMHAGLGYDLVHGRHSALQLTLSLGYAMADGSLEQFAGGLAYHLY